MKLTRYEVTKNSYEIENGDSLEEFDMDIRMIKGRIKNGEKSKFVNETTKLFCYANRNREVYII